MFGFKFRKAKSDAVTGFLGSQTEFAGKLAFTGVVHLDGQFQGEIVSRGTLVVGPESVIRAQIQSNVLKIAGEVRGNLTATEKIELYPQARVFGDIRTPSLMVEEGAFFEGTCKMTAAREAIAPFVEPEAAFTAEEPEEAISAQAWPLSYDREESPEEEDRRGHTLPKASR
ncbi:MAG: polymer-forming cytoskeletal protein [Deltaproteobacteria bacterium]|nr:polymer-forming cytoskeletal protein [Deltaproteobacteria bacterium]